MLPLSPIERIISLARRRLLASVALDAATRSSMGIGIGLVCLAVLAKVVPTEWAPDPAAGTRWLIVGLGFALAAVGGWSLVRVARARRDHANDVAVASLVDVRLGLHDRLSTAVAVAARTDPFARAAIEEGVRISGDRRVVVGLSQAIPISPPRRWWIGPACFAAAVTVWVFLPAFGWSPTRTANADDAAAEIAAARESSKVQIDTVEARIDENPQLSQEMAKLADQKSTIGERAEEKVETPDDVRRETTRQVNDMAKRLDEILNSEKAQQLEAMKEALSRVEPAEGSPLKDLAEALKQGDPSKAKAALEKLEKEIASGDLDPKAREELGKRLDELAKQLSEAASSREALKKALEAAGLDGDLAKNPDAAKSAIDNAKGLNESQKDALRKALAAQKAAGQKLDQVAQACKSMSSQCKNPGAAKDGSASACKGASESLSDMEMLNEMMKDAEACRSACQGSCHSPSDMVSPSSRMNANSGQAMGGERSKRETATGTKSRKEKVAVEGGEIIARQLVDAPPLQGASRTAVEALSGEIGTGYEDGTEDDPVPAHLRDVHKRYFGDIKKKIDEKGAKDGAQQPPPPPPATKPAPPSK